MIGRNKFRPSIRLQRSVPTLQTSFDKMSARIFEILDFSDEILIGIISRLNARERGWLGNSCTKFHRLVFGEKQFFRDLDFSEEGYLTSSCDVRQYFKDDSMCRHVRRINLDSIYCSSPEPVLQDIRKATNLVELNIIGVALDTLLQLWFLLEPLENLRKLSACWPKRIDFTDSVLLEKPFNRLKHLTMRVDNFHVIQTFIPVLLRYTQELEELFILVVYPGCFCNGVTGADETLDGLELILPLSKLKIFGSYNVHHFPMGLDYQLTPILPDLEQWTEFDMGWQKMLYYEKDAEVNHKTSSHVKNRYQPYFYHHLRPIKFLRPGCLLADTIENASGVNAKNFYLLAYAYEVSLKMQDIKLLLENPSHRIPYIRMHFDQQPTCTEYLSVFPHLTELILDEAEGEYSEGPIKKQISNLAFHKLVENTPHLRNFTMYPKSRKNGYPWDFSVLYSISGWKELRTLFLAKIPIVSGKFLIEIGKQCENLEKLRLEDLGPCSNCCYKKDLSEMLTHCHNLKDFSIQQNNLGRVCDVFAMFGNNCKLRRFHVTSSGERTTFDGLMPSAERFIRSHNLILFACEFQDLGRTALDDLTSNLERLKNVLGRTSFEFQIVGCLDLSRQMEYGRNHSLEFAHKDLLLPFSITNALYELGC